MWRKPQQQTSNIRDNHHPHSWVESQKTIYLSLPMNGTWKIEKKINHFYTKHERFELKSWKLFTAPLWRPSRPTCATCTPWSAWYLLCYFTPYSLSSMWHQPFTKEPASSYLNSSGYINPLKCQPFLRERVRERESASREWAERQRGSPRLDSKKLSSPLFCWWRQNPLKQSAQNKCTWAAGPKATWLFHTGLHGSILGGQGHKGRGGGVGGWGRVLGCEAAAAAAPCSPVVLSGVLELWMCKGMQYCCGQWNMLKCTLSFRVSYTHTHTHTDTHTRLEQTHDYRAAY